MPGMLQSKRSQRIGHDLMSENSNKILSEEVETKIYFISIVE